MHVDLGGYHVSDIEFTCAFDINRTKVGKDLGEAIWADPNNTIKFTKVPRKLGVPVHRGMTHDGLGKYLKEKITKAKGETADIVSILKETHTDVVVSYLPVGSEQATKWYVEQILEAGCAFVNCIPVFIAREDYWNKRFRKAGLPIIGDDIKSQVGATIVHRTLARLFHERGVKMLRTSQLNVGGNMDFYNMLERERLESKKISKTNAVTSIMGHELPKDDVYIGPSDYVPWLTDRKWAHIRVEGQAFGDVPLNLEMKLEVWDSPNSAGIVIDAVRLCKLAPQPRPLRPARRPELVPHEVAEEPAPRRRGARGDREVHRQVRRQGAPARRRQAPRRGRREARRPAGGGGRPTRLRARVSVRARARARRRAARPASLPRALVAVLARAHRRAAPTRACRDLPFTTKADLRADQAAHPPFGARLCAPREALVRLHVTCGTTGEPVAIGLTARRPRRQLRDRRRGVPHRRRAAGRHDRPLPELRPLRRRHRRPHGARGLRRDRRAGRRRAVAAPARAHPGARDHARSSGRCRFPAHLAARAREAGLDPRALGLRHLVTAGEPGAGLAPSAREIEAAWGATVADTFGMSDVWSTMAGECGRGRRACT